jgi:hypothetical protein
MPMIAKYNRMGKVVEVDSNRPIEAVFEDT